MLCLNCHTDELSLDVETCPQCGVHIPSLLRDILPSKKTLRQNTYCLDYPLGRGSFGITYCAHHCILKNKVAIKEFYPQEIVIRHSLTQDIEPLAEYKDAYQRALHRFLQEGQILAKFNHPNILKVRDWFAEKNTAYLVMDLIEGKPLNIIQDHYPKRQLPSSKIEHFITQLVNALTAIHQASIYHLDLKPENLLITPQQQLIVIDFGAAKQAIHAKHRGTRSYTESYAAPEIIMGGEVGSESDLFEVGMLLYELLTGCLPPPALSRFLENETWNANHLSSPWNFLLNQALALRREERPHNIGIWWQSRHQIPDFIAKKSLKPRNYPPLYSLLPDLKRNGMKQRWGRGWIKAVIPLNEDEAILLSAGGVTQLNLRKKQVQWEIDCPVECGAMSPDQRLLAVVWEQQIYLWDLANRRLLQHLAGHQKAINHVALSSQGRLVVSGSQDETLRLWDGFSGREQRLLEEPTGEVISVAVTADGRKVISGSQDGTIRVWDGLSGEELWKGHSHQGAINCLCLSFDEQWLASGGRDGLIGLWDLKTGDLLHVLRYHQSWISAVAFSLDNGLLASASRLADTAICIWEVETGKLKQILEGHWNSLTSVAFCPESRFLLSSSYDYTLRLWNLEIGQQVYQCHIGTNWVYSVAISEDGCHIATGNNDKTIKLWHREQTELIKTLYGHEDAVSTVEFNPDGRFIASGSWDGTVRLWERETGEMVRLWQGHQNWVTQVAFSPDGRMIGSISWDATVKLWEISVNRLNTTMNKPLRTLKGHPDEVETLAFSPDGHLLATGGHDKILRLWEVSSGQELRQLKGHHRSIKSLTFSPDGQFLLSGSRDKSLRLWHVLSGQQMHIFRGHTEGVTTVAFHPDGQLLVSGSRDKTLRLWDLMSGEVIKVIRGHTSSINNLAFTMEGSGLIVADNDGIVRFWAI